MSAAMVSKANGRSHIRPDRVSSVKSFQGAAKDGFEEKLLGALPRLRRIASALAGSAADGEDLLQDTLERALERKSQWQCENLGGWLYAIMRHLNANNRRHKNCLPMIDIDRLDNLSDGNGEAEGLYRLRLEQAIHALTPQYRNVVLLHVIEGYGYKDVALKLEIPVGTVMSRLSRAQHMLAASLEHSDRKSH